MENEIQYLERILNESWDNKGIEDKLQVLKHISNVIWNIKDDNEILNFINKCISLKILNSDNIIQLIDVAAFRNVKNTYNYAKLLKSFIDNEKKENIKIFSKNLQYVMDHYSELTRNDDFLKKTSSNLEFSIVKDEITEESKAKIKRVKDINAYLVLAARYGSYQWFNFILTNFEVKITEEVIISSFFGGNEEIVEMMKPHIDQDNSILMTNIVNAAIESRHHFLIQNHFFDKVKTVWRPSLSTFNIESFEYQLAKNTQTNKEENHNDEISNKEEIEKSNKEENKNEMNSLNEESFVNTNEKFINAVDSENRSALHSAVENNLLVVVEYLVEKLKSNIDCINENLTMPIHIACFRGYLDIVKYLCERGCNAKSFENSGYCSLHCATAGGHLDVVKYLIEERKIDINIVSNKNITALYSSAQDIDIIKYLVSNHADVNTATADKRCHPISNAIISKNFEIVKYLLENGADLKQFENGKKTQLMIACEYSTAEITNLLLSKNAEITTRDCCGSTALYYAAAAKEESPEKTSLILNRMKENSNSIKDYVNSKQKWELSPLMYGAMNGNAETIKLLLDNGADPDQKNRFGMTALHYASRYEKFEAVRALTDYILREQGRPASDIDIPDDSSFTPFLYSLKYNYRNEISKYLYSLYPNVKEPSSLKGATSTEIAELEIKMNQLFPNHKKY
ncbi:hypothetical protein TVAG_108460 [Trichomonas vaginalis G3]|uniref:Uncharacterized protein n=1 Tax=Trichomonas vaginalis (strain ATCC PRA-98 / G3) TaxID=412133 RepID=A2EQH0_TRIV3|nr:hypothetical protein TVAG_108460 [Trichomonas vaginalis G3]|eukprot:XP_001317335.1 hypothetical protein [Trichomonas vaginalis G3]